MRRVARQAALAAAVVAAAVIRPAAQAASPAPQDVQTLIAQLRDASAARRLAAVRQLAVAGNSVAADYVAPLITDPDDNVQFAAIDAELTFFLTEPADVAATRDRSRAQEAFDAGPTARAAARAPGVLIDQLITAAADANARVRFDAIHALGVIAEPPLGVDETRRLMTGLQHRDEVVRAATARVLGRLRAAAAADALVAALNDRSPIVQKFAAESLGLLRYDRAIQALADRIAYFGKGEPVNDGLLALARIGHPSSREIFRARLNAAEPAERRAALEGLGRIRDRASLDAIRAVAKADPSNDVRLAGLFALDLLGEPQVAGLAAVITQPGIGPAARDYLLELGPTAAPAVAAALTASHDDAQRAALAGVLGLIGGAAEAAALDSLARDVNPRVARAASQAAARIRR